MDQRTRQLVALRALVRKVAADVDAVAEITNEYTKKRRVSNTYWQSDHSLEKTNNALTS